MFVLGASKRNALPDSWLKVTSESTGKKVYTIVGFCNVEVNVDSEGAKLTVKEADGCIVPSLNIVFSKLFPSVNIHTSTEQFILPDSFSVEEIFINKQKFATIKAKAKATWRIADGEILINNGELELGFHADKQVSGFKDWSLNAKGKLARQICQTLF